MRSGLGNTTDRDTMNRIRILMVEDSLADAELIEHEMRQGGILFDAKRADEREDFLRELEEFKPDLILADYTLPSFNGMEALSLLMERNPDLPFIFVSGTIGEEKAIEGMKQGATDYVLKSSLSRLVPSIKRALKEVQERTDRKRAEENLQVRERTLSTLMSNLPGMAYRCKNEPQWTMEFVSEGCLSLTGYQPDDLMENGTISYGDLILPEYREYVWDEVQKAVQNARPFELQYCIKTAHETIKWVYERGCSVSSQEKGESKLEGFIEDVTARVQAQEALTKSQQHYRNLADEAQKSRDAFFNMLDDVSQSYRELETLFLGLVKAMVNALDAKSRWTRGHSERVAFIASKIAEKAGMNQDEVKKIQLASLLHDIGKIGTYDYLLDKPERLTPEEFEVVKKHPAQGHDILRGIKQLLDIIPFIRHHHERIDGRGYPDGLQGEEIPFGARIIHIADSYDSMTADRPYRPAPGKDYAISELKRCSGTQFDADIAGIFLKIIEKSEM